MLDLFSMAFILWLSLELIYGFQLPAKNSLMWYADLPETDRASINTAVMNISKSESLIDAWYDIFVILGTICPRFFSICFM